MKLEAMRCPACGATYDLDVKDNKIVFCPLCGSQFSVDNGDRTYTYNYNVNERYTNDAEVERERRLDRENKRDHKELAGIWIGLAVFVLIIFALPIFMIIKTDRDEKRAIAGGMIQIGTSADDMEGEKYQGVVDKLEAAGFTNITTVDLDEDGLFNRKADKIESISINGDSSFYSDDYFDPDSRIIISYY